MGLFTTLSHEELEKARADVHEDEVVCPGCKQSFHVEGRTLEAVNGALGLEAHKCPHCGFVLSRRRPSTDGL